MSRAWSSSLVQSRQVGIMFFSLISFPSFFSFLSSSSSARIVRLSSFRATRDLAEGVWLHYGPGCLKLFEWKIIPAIFESSRRISSTTSSEPFPLTAPASYVPTSGNFFAREYHAGIGVRRGRKASWNN